MSNFKVRFTQLKDSDRNSVVLNKVYEVKDGRFIDETGWEYTSWARIDDSFKQFKKWFERDGVTKLELVEEENKETTNTDFTLSDLKDGMVVTYRNGETRYVFREEFYDITYGNLTGYTFEDYNEDLLHHGGNNDEDIVKVEYMNEILWQRKEKEYYILKEAYNKANGKRIKHKDSDVYTSHLNALIDAIDITGKTTFEVLRLKEFEIEE